MTQQMQRTANRRNQILAAALALISEQGVQGVTIAQICQRSGASVGSLYHHFGDREGVLYGLYHESFADCFGQLRQAVTATTSARAGIEVLVHTYLRWVAANPERASFIYEASQGNLLRRYLTEIQAFKGEFYAAIFAWMRPFIAVGELIELPPWAYDAIIMGPAHEFSRRWLGGMRELPLVEAEAIIAAAIWRAVQAPLSNSPLLTNC